LVFANGNSLFYQSSPEDGTFVYQNGEETLNFEIDPSTGTEAFEYPDGTGAYFEHENGRLMWASNETCKVKLSYDAEGRIIAEDVAGRIVHYERNALGKLTALITPEGDRLVFDLDTEQRLREVQDDSGNRFAITYEPSGALQTIHYPNGVVLTRT